MCFQIRSWVFHLISAAQLRLDQQFCGVFVTQEEKLHEELRARGLRVDAGIDELRRLLLSAVSIELGLAHKALAEVATTLIDKVSLALGASEFKKNIAQVRALCFRINHRCTTLNRGRF